MSVYTEEHDDVQFSEPILAQKGVRLGITFAEKTQWEAKTGGNKDGRKFDACKLTLQISDDSVRTEHDGSKIKTVIEDQFNIVRFPYEDKKTGEPKWLGRNKLYQLEEAFGFEPLYKDASGNAVDAYITRTGRKVAPKVDGVKRAINPDFFNAYFNEDGSPKTDEFIGKEVYADVGLEKSEKFGDKNVIDRYVRAPEV